MKITITVKYARVPASFLCMSKQQEYVAKQQEYVAKQQEYVATTSRENNFKIKFNPTLCSVGESYGHFL